MPHPERPLSVTTMGTIHCRPSSTLCKNTLLCFWARQSASGAASSASSLRFPSGPGSRQAMFETLEIARPRHPVLEIVSAAALPAARVRRGLSDAPDQRPIAERVAGSARSHSRPRTRPPAGSKARVGTKNGGKCGAPERIRTPNPQIRSHFGRRDPLRPNRLRRSKLRRPPWTYHTRSAREPRPGQKCGV